METVRDDRTLKSELTKAIATQLAYFEWLDGHPGEMFVERFYEEFAGAAAVKLHSDALFRVKVETMLNATLFVLENPTTVDERRKDRSELLTHYANMLVGAFGGNITTEQAMDDLLKPISRWIHPRRKLP